MMTRLLRALLVEDSEDDAQLMLRELRRHGYELNHERVETRAAMEQALLQKEWDIILCDYNLPQFNAMEALTILNEIGLDVPFFVVSGTIQEEAAVAALKAGAHDFIVKGRFARLVPAIERETQDAQIRRSQREGEAERANLTTSLDAVSAELERFLYTAFHDLRAPLVTIKGFLGFLHRDLQANRLDEAQRDIERIVGAANKIDELLSGLLKLSQIGRVICPFEDIDLVQLTLEILNTLETRLRSKSIIVNLSPNLPVIYGDRLRIHEVMENLIENSVKNMADRPVTEIEIGTEKRESEQVIFVKDNGIGIDPRYHNRIFNLFEKLDPSMEGPGIGLAIVKRIVEAHGGRIWVESAGVGQGSTFCFSIPNSRSQ